MIGIKPYQDLVPDGTIVQILYRTLAQYLYYQCSLETEGVWHGRTLKRHAYKLKALPSFVYTGIQLRIK